MDQQPQPPHVQPVPVSPDAGNVENSQEGMPTKKSGIMRAGDAIRNGFRDGFRGRVGPIIMSAAMGAGAAMTPTEAKAGPLEGAFKEVATHILIGAVNKELGATGFQITRTPGGALNINEATVSRMKEMQIRYEPSTGILWNGRVNIKQGFQLDKERYRVDIVPFEQGAHKGIFVYTYYYNTEFRKNHVEKLAVTIDGDGNMRKQVMNDRSADTVIQ